MRVGSLFSGIGGLDLGLERAGMHVVWQCEADPYCRAVLRKHWPDVPCFEDVRELGADAPGVDVLCGGFPCQPVSKAGRRRAQNDERWLWPHFARLVGDLRPRYVLVENVPGLLTAAGGDAMGEVLGDLASIGYDTEWQCIPAAAVGALHLRDRIFILAYPNANGRGLDPKWEVPPILHGGEPLSRREPGELRPHVPDAYGEPISVQAASVATAARAREDEGPQWERLRLDPHDGAAGDGYVRWASEPDVGRLVDGLPSPLARRRLAALGNAVVPQVAEWIGRQIMRAEPNDRSLAHRRSATAYEEEE